MDPVGLQKKIAGNSHKISLDKLIDGGGAKSDYDGMNYPRNTRSADKPWPQEKWKGKERGNTKHTYGVDGENRD